MFREMRRKKQELSEEDCLEVLSKGTHGILAVSGDGGYPYAVPLNYAYDGGKLYFHSALEGHKIDAVRRGDKASFCVVERDDVVAEEYTTYFRSVIAFGRVSELTGEEEKIAAMKLLADKYAPDNTAERFRQSIDRSLPRTAVLVLTIEHMTGKEAVELVKRRQNG